MVKRDETFNAYHGLTQENRLAVLRRALKILGNAKYQNITNLAEAAARLVTEVELKEALDGVIPDPCSYTTLLRNKKYYRPVLDAYFEGADEDDEPRSPISVEDHEALKIHCANISHQNSILKDRLTSIDLSGSTSQLIGDDSSQSNRGEDIRFLISLTNNIISEVPDLFDTVSPDDLDKDHPEAGLYGPDGLVLTWVELERFEGLNNEFAK